MKSRLTRSESRDSGGKCRGSAEERRGRGKRWSEEFGAEGYWQRGWCGRRFGGWRRVGLIVDYWLEEV